MTEEESDFESSRFGSTAFDYAAVDPDDVCVVMKKTMAFVAGIWESGRTDKSRRIRFACARWIVTKRGTISALARELGVSRQRVHRVIAEIKQQYKLG